MEHTLHIIGSFNLLLVTAFVAFSVFDYFLNRNRLP